MGSLLENIRGGRGGSRKSSRGKSRSSRVNTRGGSKSKVAGRTGERRR